MSTAQTHDPGAPVSLEAVAAELHHQRWHLGFSAPVEQRFELDQADTRSRELIQAGLVALLIYDLFLINDWLVRPQVLGIAALWRLGCVTVYGLAVLGAIRRGLPPGWREAAIASTIVVTMAASGMIFQATSARYGAYDPFVFSLIFMAGNIYFPLRFIPALLSSTLALLIAAMFVLSHATMPEEAKPFALGLLLGTLAFTVLAGYRIERSTRKSYLLLLQEELRSLAALHNADKFAALSRTDALTQLANRRAFESARESHWIEAAQRGTGLALLMLDIDHFKQYNDQYGHPAGDQCLRMVADALQASVREGDFLARIGGEEFVVLMPAHTIASVHATAERLRQGVERLAIRRGRAANPAVVTISVGAAICWPAKGGTPLALMAAADSALYEAKGSGRNRWVMATPVPV